MTEHAHEHHDHHDHGEHHAHEHDELGTHEHHAHAEPHGHDARPQSLNRLAASATAHCLTGCAIGEVLGMVIGTTLGWSDWATIALAVVLAFFFGYSLTMLPLLRSRIVLAAALPLAFASDTFSIAVMELVDNAVMVLVPGAMDAYVDDLLFWGALAFALAVAFVAAFPVNRYLIARGRGHAVVHQFHHGGAGAHAGHATTDEAAVPRPAFARMAVVALLTVAFVATAAAGMGALVEGGDDSMGGHGSGQAAEPREEAGHAAGAAAGQGGEAGHGTGAAAGQGEDATHGGAEEEGAAASGLAVDNGEYALSLADSTLEPARSETFSFRVLDENGGVVRAMDEEGGGRMHLIVVRRDLVGYQHLHPELAGDGSWRTAVTLPQAGVYRAFADFEVDGERVVLGTDLFVPGDFMPAAVAPPERSAAADGYAVSLDPDAHAGTEGELAFRITRGGRPVDVEPYLGADGHLVALREGDLAYLHVHPDESRRRGDVRFAATFPTAGSYRLFLQFKDAGKVRTAAFGLNVAR